jgi:hypothetical protein
MENLKIDFYKNKYFEELITFKEKLSNKKYSIDDKNNLKYMLEENKNLSALLFYDKIIIGEIVYIIEKNTLIIYQFKILNNFRGKKLGTKLINFLKMRYNNYQIELIVEGGTSKNKKLIDYYFSLDFEVVDVECMRLKK